MRIHFLCLVLAAGCVDATVASDGRDDSFTSPDGKTDTAGISEESPAALAILALVNDSSETELTDDVGLSTRTAHNIASSGSTFGTLAELDAVPYVGPIAFHKLLAYAKANGLVETTGTVGNGKLLDCNTSFGPDQQVTVIGDGTSLTLVELTTSGSTVTHPLSLAAWSSKKIPLRDDFGSKSTLTKEAGDWVERTSGGGVNEIGIADCWIDKSH
jgi:hypothetical protein